MVTTRSSKPSSTSPTSSTTMAASTTSSQTFTHTPTLFTLLWLLLATPLVIWDTGYVLGRPHTMPGGPWHWPLWVPYELYGQIDGVYGMKQWAVGNGFTAAQSWMNVMETVLYGWYLWICLGGQGKGLGMGRMEVKGRRAAVAVVVMFAAAVMTLSKTMLYALNEACSGWENVRHNTAIDLVVLYILPNGAWLIGPSYLCWVFGNELMDGLVGSKATAVAKRD